MYSYCLYFVSTVCCIVIYLYLWDVVILFFFFFEQKTAYEMRISDWSSDVCSSDLQRIGRIDRIGQRSPSIDIINLIAAETIEEQVYDRLYLRLGIIQETLGDLEPILGEIIRDIEFILTNPELSPEARAREFDPSIQAAETRKLRSEERRVGKEGVSQYRTRWRP